MGGQRPFAGTRPDDEVAPIPAVRVTATDRLKSTHTGPSSYVARTALDAPQPSFAAAPGTGSAGWKAAFRRSADQTTVSAVTKFPPTPPAVQLSVVPR